MPDDSNAYSKQISEICTMFRQAQTDHAFFTGEVNRYDRITQDLLHKLELENLKYKERAKLSTQLQTVRQERRKCKDNAAKLTPIVEFLGGAKGSQMMGHLNEALGKTRKIERIHRVPQYVVFAVSLNYI